MPGIDRSHAAVALLVFRAASADEVRAWMAGDPSMQAGTFTNTVHPINVFYPGELEAPPR